MGKAEPGCLLTHPEDADSVRGDNQRENRDQHGHGQGTHSEAEPKPSQGCTVLASRR